MTQKSPPLWGRRSELAASFIEPLLLFLENLPVV